VPKITSIKPQKNNKRVNIYLDNKFGFGIDLESFTKLGLKVEQELTDGQVEKIVKKAEFQKTLDKLLKFATLRPRSEKEINDWYKRKKIHQALIKNLFNRLNRLNLIDDEAFAAWWVGQRNQFKPRGKIALRHELLTKGVNRQIIDSILEKTNINEEKMARKLLEARGYRWKNLSKLEARQKMTRFLAGKGFGWGIIEKALHKR
jgi:regulatory protein